MSAVVAGDIQFRYSVTTGSAGNTVAGVAGGAQGKYISTTQLATSGGNEIFDDISGAQNAASQVDYRGIFIYNANASNDLQNAVAYLSAEVAGGASIAIGVDTVAASALGGSSAQGLTTANVTTAPSGVTFSSPTTSGAGIALGTIPKGYVKQLWVRRTAANSAALSADGVTIAVTGDTGSL